MCFFLSVMIISTTGQIFPSTETRNSWPAWPAYISMFRTWIQSYSCSCIHCKQENVAFLGSLLHANGLWNIVFKGWRTKYKKYPTLLLNWPLWNITLFHCPQLYSSVSSILISSDCKLLRWLTGRDSSFITCTESLWIGSCLYILCTYW